MNKIIFTMAICIVFSHNIFAVDVNNNESTTPPQNARYEIVQSQLVRRNTFRLDRFAGNVAQLTSGLLGMMWEEMYIRDFPKIEQPTEARFQLFTSGLMARDTFLIDTKTGKTWQLQLRTEDNVLIWEPLL